MFNCRAIISKLDYIIGTAYYRHGEAVDLFKSSVLDAIFCFSSASDIQLILCYERMCNLSISYTLLTVF